MIVLVLLLTTSYLLREMVGLDVSWFAILPAILYVLLQYKPRWQTAFFIVYGCFLLFNSQALFNSLRVLLNEGILVLAHWGWMLPLQQTTSTDASIGLGLLFIAMVAMLSIRTVWLLIIGAICLPLLTKQPFHFLSFSLFFISCLLMIQYLKHRSFSILQTGLVVVICCITLPIQVIPSVQQLGYSLEQTKNTLQYGASVDTQFTNGRLQQLTAFDKTATPAFRIAMEQPRAMYLKSYVGARYDNGWTDINEHLLQDQTIIKHLEGAQHFPATQFAQATQDETTSTVSIERLALSKAFALVPYELASTINGFNVSSAIWQSDQLFGTANYTFQMAQQSYANYPAVASTLYDTQDTSYLKLEALHNHLSYRYYTDIPQDTRTLLRNHFDTVEHKTYEQTIAEVQAKVASITYNENPATTKQDFVQFLLENSKEGYSVHYATLATLLFRYYGVPARYVEGYIISNEDVASAGKELTITSDARHAWTEIYVDWIGWMPIEVTPGYADKMPIPATTTFEQSGSTATQGTTDPTPTISQVADVHLEDKSTTASQQTSDFRYAWLLLLLLIPIIWLWKRRPKISAVQRQFIQFITYSRKKGHHALPVHTIIQQLQTPEALAAYQLYNDITYNQQPIHPSHKRQMKQLVKILKKQLLAKGILHK